MTVVYAAVVTGGFSVIVALLQSHRKRNTLEHMENAGRLDSIIAAAGRIEEKIDHHLADHKDGTV